MKRTAKPWSRRKLKAHEVAAISRPGLYPVATTLYVRATASRRGGVNKSWLQRIRIDGVQCDFNLGRVESVTITKAKATAAARRVDVDNGTAVTPAAAKAAKAAALQEAQQAAIPTFADMAERVYRKSRDGWRSETTRRNWRESMARHVIPKIGALRIDRVSQANVLDVLNPIIEAGKPELARKVRQRIQKVLKTAMAYEYVSRNVAGKAIDEGLSTTDVKKQNFRALPYRQLPAAFSDIRADKPTASRLALQLVMLTACRSGEARGAKWDEIVGDVWTIPASRMKTEKEHRIPLSGAALDVLDRARALDDGSGLIFPSPMKRGNPLSNMTLTKVLRDKGLAEATTVHGLRSTFRDWCGEKEKTREIAEAALAHKVRGVEGDYFRTDLFNLRVTLMAQWARFVTGERGGVIEGHFAGKAG